MPAVGLTREQYESVFGKPLDDRQPGRSVRCKSCGGWHSTSKPWPHNCLPPAPPRNPDLTTPMIAPPFVPFRTGVLEGSEIINSRSDKREFMEKNDLVEWDSGVKQEGEPSERVQKRVFAEEVTRFQETDPLNIEPVDRIGETDLDGTEEITTEGMEVFDD